jgi:hypothetical protein
MEYPKFRNGEFIINDYASRELILTEKAWKHIIIDNNRRYFERSFDKITDTIKNPDQVRSSTQEKNVVIYEKFFDDFYITDSVLGRTYINVVVNRGTGRIRTAFSNLKKRQTGKQLWPQ